MRRRAITLGMAFSIALAGAVPALAILYGGPDGNDHPYVGLAVFFDASGTRLGRCSGTLLSEKILLTAGHCTDGAATAQVWFDAAIGLNSPSFTGVPHTHPDFNDSAFPNRRDVGVVVFGAAVPVPGSLFATLPALGALDDLATRRGPDYPIFTIVGYGFQSVKPDLRMDLIRFRGATKLVNLRSALTDGFNLQMSSDPGRWAGGICFGDSGGPVFLGDTNVVVAVDSFVMNSNCTGSGFAYRTDIFDAQSFILPFLRP